MGGVYTACDGSCQTVPVDGAEACTSHSAPHNRVAHDGSPGVGHRILSSLGLLWFVFHIAGPDVHRFVSSFGVDVLFISFTGILTYWLVVGLYRSMQFYQVARERQTIAAQLETQLSHAELENLKSPLHPHFLFNSLHAIGVLMQEDVDAAGRLLVSLGDLLRMAFERRKNEITYAAARRSLLPRPPVIGNDTMPFQDCNELIASLKRIEAVILWLLLQRIASGPKRFVETL